MRITLESDYGATKVSASVDVPDTQATGEELEWLAGIFKGLIEDGLLINRG